MRYLLLCVFLLFFGNTFAQYSISGKVVAEDNTSLPGASIYFNNTTIGTTSDKNGDFTLNFPAGNYVLVVSFLGYEPKEIPIDTTQNNSFFNIKLKESAVNLSEVVVTQEIFGDEWKYNLERFKDAFLGKTKLAETCKIINEKDLRFNYDVKTNTLTAYALRPLKINNKGLGYLITYDLVEFKIIDKYSFFSGYARYKNRRKHIRKKWKNNRLKAYNGSRMHFFRSLIHLNVKENGFVVNQFKRLPNPERPSEEEIKWARTVIMMSGESLVFKDIKEPKTQLDSAMVIMKKTSLPKYMDYLYKKDVSYNDMISYEKNTSFLNFENYLMVTYLNEPEEDNYFFKNFSKHKKQQVQTSNIVLNHGKVELIKIGIVARPDAITNEGYWAFEAFATMLPFDYVPSKN